MSSSSSNDALVGYIKEKLECNICLSYAGDQAVQTVCGGNHTFCFKCIVKYVTQTFKANSASSIANGDINCPVCRGGECSVIPSIFLKELGGMVGAEADEVMEEGTIQDGYIPAGDWLGHYKEKRKYMKRKFPFSFKTNDKMIITTSQMVVYWRYREDILSFIVRSYRLKPPPMNTSWIVLLINEASGDFCCTSHSSAEQARLVMISSPSTFTQSFLCVSTLDNDLGMRSASVIIQDRPEKREVEPPIKCETYFSPPMFPLGKALRVIQVINRLINSSGTGRDYPLTDESENEEDAQDISRPSFGDVSWLPM